MEANPNRRRARGNARPAIAFQPPSPFVTVAFRLDKLRRSAVIWPRRGLKLRPPAEKDPPLTLRRAAPAFAALSLICAAAPAALADPTPDTGLAPPVSSLAPPPLSADDKAQVQKALDYLQDLKAAQGRFTQLDPKGRVSNGTFSMLRPGRARFQYDPPAALLVVADARQRLCL